MIYVACDRYSKSTTKFDYYTPDWEWIDVKNGHENNGPNHRPSTLEELKEASRLSSQFPLDRVDLYDVDGIIIFGELTFTHFGCVRPFTPDSFDYEFGSLFPDVKKASIIKV